MCRFSTVADSFSIELLSGRFFADSARAEFTWTVHSSHIHGNYSEGQSSSWWANGGPKLAEDEETSDAWIPRHIKE